MTGLFFICQIIEGRLVRNAYQTEVHFFKCDKVKSGAGEDLHTDPVNYAVY